MNDEIVLVLVFFERSELRYWSYRDLIVEIRFSYKKDIGQFIIFLVQTFGIFWVYFWDGGLGFDHNLNQGLVQSNITRFARPFLIEKWDFF